MYTSIAYQTYLFSVLEKPGSSGQAPASLLLINWFVRRNKFCGFVTGNKVCVCGGRAAGARRVGR